MYEVTYCIKEREYTYICDSCELNDIGNNGFAYFFRKDEIYNGKPTLIIPKESICAILLNP